MNKSANIITAPTYQKIAALPVYYRGYHCRSRLEGRWMRFFDAMGIDFEYEPQGFKFSDGTCYLPDFHFIGTSTWAEVKPVEFSADEKCRCEQLVMGMGGTCLFLVGVPDFRAYDGICRDCEEITATTFSLDCYGLYKRQHRFFSDPGEMDEAGASSRYRKAIYAARAERFDGRELPMIGHELFNLSEREMGECR